MRAPLYPPPLKKGDTVGIIAPAGQLQDKSRFMQGVAILQEMGFAVKYPPQLWPGPGYLADSDDKRGFEFNHLVEDPEINGLICLRGGYGCLRMLEKIDLDLLTRNPKIVAGFSDITLLQNFLHQQIGLVSLHGPVVTSLAGATEDSLAVFYDCLTSIKPPRMVYNQVEVLRHGATVTAPLIGGNLASLVTLLGTPYDFSWDDKIVFLEDINEPAYKVDRMLTQLYLARKLEKIAGLILGDFSTSACCNEIEKIRYRNAIWDRILELCPVHSIPVWGDFPSGHCARNLTFPLGAMAEMDSGVRSLFFQ
ncbi:LD-carboxypeptidase [Desulfopila sp. IMCC35006]|uniref:S66 peptidase family protein n=1 Tax=Desulfopila sp. IMCC35006 TaxID=2569542 RepID=UPI0010AC4D18|nr:LD-carboxypeptidase [Desulfopila sp. IMCC35006]TKB27373.1 LD-carboxypeptidase [Desulfopila sp. IMCC35006]